ncbi:MAG: hypothetical protein JSV92_04200 [archaeon]|nr:MAG: hypothetical protein JSV92_04200 [archaeon]
MNKKFWTGLFAILFVLIGIWFLVNSQTKGQEFCFSDEDCICCDYVYFNGELYREEICINKYSEARCDQIEHEDSWSANYEPVCENNRCVP